MVNFHCNCCDGVYNSIDVHFTSLCDNKCKHCIDNKYRGVWVNTPDVEKISNTIIANKEKIDDVLFLGGEPCLFIDELIKCVEILKNKTRLKLFVTTSVPLICCKEFEKFSHLISILDGINLSVQSNNEDVSDSIRGTRSKYDRQSFYRCLPNKEKIRINLNIVKPYLYKKEDIETCIRHYDKMGFNSIKLSEIQHGKDFFVSFENTFGVKFGSAYSSGCQKYLDNDRIFPGTKTKILLKRSCFLCEQTLNASLADGVKVISKLFIKPKNKYGVVYENGELTGGWI